MSGGHGVPRRFAVLIDADNARAPSIEEVLEHVGRHGTAVIRRAYGDWTSNRLSGWKSVLNANAILPVQQFAYTAGKNATDMALVIDAMDLLHAKQADGFCIVSSDSDFTRLATRLRESGMMVLGCGDEWAPKAFTAACDEFVPLKGTRGASSQNGHARNLSRAVNGIEPYAAIVRTATHEDLFTPRHPVKPAPKLAAAGAPSQPLPQPTRMRSPKRATGRVTTPRPAPAPLQRKSSEELQADGELTGLLQAAILSQSDVDGWAELGSVAAFVRTHLPEFRPKNYGYAQFQGLVEATGMFVLREQPNERSPKNVRKFIRPREAERDELGY
ncbi:MAG: NYN domain-containing protein [Planctomycetaceae bacterium]|nr:NYN domain-containing protein [Planctomycetaceae bacterium]